MRIILHAIPRARARRSAHTCNCVLPRHKNSEHTRNSFRGKCPMIVPSFFTATAYRLEDFSHTNASNRCRPYFFYICGSRKYNSFRKTLPWQLLSPYILRFLTSML